MNRLRRNPGIVSSVEAVKFVCIPFQARLVRAVIEPRFDLGRPGPPPQNTACEALPASLRTLAPRKTRKRPQRAAAALLHLTSAPTDARDARGCSEAVAADYALSDHHRLHCLSRSNTWHATSDRRHATLHTGHWTLDTGHWTLDR